MDARMNFSFDFDGTITSDPDVFMVFAKLLRQRGHKVYIVTMRYPSECAEIETNWGPHVDGIFATSRGPKAPFMLARNIPIHIWIDDNPRAIQEHATAIWGSASPEGRVYIEDHGDNGGVRIVDIKPTITKSMMLQAFLLKEYMLVALGVACRPQADQTEAQIKASLIKDFDKRYWAHFSQFFVDPLAAKSLMAMEIHRQDNGPGYDVVLPKWLTLWYKAGDTNPVALNQGLLAKMPLNIMIEDRALRVDLNEADYEGTVNEIRSLLVHVT